jgi:hypothetical protein
MNVDCRECKNPYAPFGIMICESLIQWNSILHILYIFLLGNEQNNASHLSSQFFISIVEQKQYGKFITAEVYEILITE